MTSLTPILTLARREVRRIFRIWSQTILPPIITTSLYFIIFGAFLGQKVGEIQGVPYFEFIVPGLIMMGIITAAFTNTSFSYFSAKFMKNLEELLVAPMAWWEITIGFVLGGIVRGVVVGLAIGVTAFVATDLTIVSPALIIVSTLLTSTLMSLLGMIVGVYCKSFDGVNIFPTFILMPLTYLAGVFYPVTALPDPWRTISNLDPLTHVINAFRSGFYPVEGVN